MEPVKNLAKRFAVTPMTFYNHAKSSPNKTRKKRQGKLTSEMVAAAARFQLIFKTKSWKDTAQFRAEP